MLYPNLYSLIELVAADNGTRNLLKAEPEWPEQIKTFDKLEQVAAWLTDAQRETVAYGEVTEARAILDPMPYGGALHRFLDEAFDGAYYNCFWTR